MAWLVGEKGARRGGWRVMESNGVEVKFSWLRFDVVGWGPPRYQLVIKNVLHFYIWEGCASHMI